MLAHIITWYHCMITAIDIIELIVEHDNVPFFSSHKILMFVQYMPSYYKIR